MSAEKMNVTITETATKVVVLKHGSKELTLEINPLYKTASTFLNTIEGSNRIPNETTEIYRKAKELMEMEAARMGVEGIDYTLETGYKSMKGWLKTIGNKIFDWESIYPTIDDPEKIRAKAFVKRK